MPPRPILRPDNHGGDAMADLIYLALGIGAFALGAGALRLIDRM